MSTSWRLYVYKAELNVMCGVSRGHTAILSGDRCAESDREGGSVGDQKILQAVQGVLALPCRPPQGIHQNGTNNNTQLRRRM